MTAPSSSSTAAMASITANTRLGRERDGAAARQQHEGAERQQQAPRRQHQGHHLAQQDVGQPAGADGVAGGTRPSGSGEAFNAPPQPMPRTTGMSRSRIFLRSVLRFRPSIAAALIWLPRVAAKRHLDQRPLHLRDHPVVDVAHRHAVMRRGQELADVALHRGGQRLGLACAVRR